LLNRYSADFERNSARRRCRRSSGVVTATARDEKKNGEAEDGAHGSVAYGIPEFHAITVSRCRLPQAA
jgi:hypothetical protein